MWIGTISKFGVLFRFVKFCIFVARFGGTPPNLVGPFFIFEKLVSGPHWEFSHCHMAANHWSTPTTCTVTYHVIMPHQSTMSHTVCHVVVWTTMWNLLLGPWIKPKMSKMSDTWKPLVLPHHHVDIIMTHFTLYMFHVDCTSVEFICTDVDISSTDVDSSLLTGIV
jgi:hypothetical protein